MDEEEIKRRQEELEQIEREEMSGIFRPTNEEKMTSALESIDFHMEGLGLISERVDNLRLDSAGIAGDLEEIKKELNEWRYSKSSPIKYHQEAITEKIEDLERTLKEHFGNVDAQNKATYDLLKSINDELRKIQIEVNRPKNLVALLLIIIVILLWIKL